LDAVGGAFEAFALLREPLLELSDPFQKTRGEIGPLRIGEGDFPRTRSYVACILVCELADPLGGRPRVAPDAFRFLQREPAQFLSLRAGPRDHLLGLEPRVLRRNRSLGPRQLELELLGMRRERVERPPCTVELFGEVVCSRGRRGACAREL